MYGKKICFIGAIIILGWFGSCLAAEMKIGYVDIQRAVNDCQAGKEAKKTITKEFEKYQRVGAEKQKELQTMKEAFEKQAPMLNPDARTAKEKEYQSKLRDLQRWAEDSQNEINQKRMELERTISAGLQKVILKVGAEDGYTLVLEKNETIVLYASKTIDLTEKVIKLFDTQKK